ncbi:MAG TPA: glycosyltransferase [Terracidiphilus sp.]|jgi:glycosyltransferase involved in cell wall biosynthesis|nr:glycosyltransferase [Terracidiphilus sp.]
MRIAYLLNTLAIGGAERQVVALAERMAARGHVVEILVLRETCANEVLTEFPVHYLNMRRNATSVARGLLKAARLLRSFRPDILHSHNFHGNFSARVLKLAWPSIRVLSTLHNEYEGGWARMLSYRLTDFLSYHTVAVSHAAAMTGVARGAVPQRKCSVICNGIDAAEFTPNPDRRNTLRAEMNTLEHFIWMTAGRMVPAKDYPNLLLAFARVHKAAPAAQLWIVGEGNSEYTASLRVIAVHLGLETAVRWLGLRRDVAALLDAADGFVLASAWEGMPLAVGEAMAMEKPIVATRVGGVEELAGNCAILAPSHDPAALATAMVSIVNTPREAREFLGGAARQRILDHFNIQTKAIEWEGCYRAVLGLGEPES